LLDRLATLFVEKLKKKKKERGEGKRRRKGEKERGEELELIKKNAGHSNIFASSIWGGPRRGRIAARWYGQLWR
jgi:hypothetical protein